MKLMSCVNNVMLTFSIMEDDHFDRIKEINASLAMQGMGDQKFLLVDIGDHTHLYGGSKCLEEYVFIAAFNGVCHDMICNAVKSANWEYPEDVRIFYCGQDDSAFRMLDWRK